MLYSITYVSSACVPCSRADFDRLVDAGIRNNRKDAICRLLLYRNGQFMHTLEGSRRKVEDKKQRIVLDPRNHHLSVLISGYIPTLDFPGCPMGFLNLSDEVYPAVVHQNKLLQHSFDAPLFREDPNQARKLMLWARDTLMLGPAAENTSSVRVKMPDGLAGH